MATLDRIEALRRQHTTLDTQIDEEKHRPHPDDAVLAELKRQKLRIKDTIAELSRPS
ncbi:MAG: YdcH family protein [Alphaproteobacteria bacterium]|nr:YdcH family protein [Alphaproteobacteria bacterium]